MGIISANVRRILAEIPPGVEVVAAAKGRRPEEIREAVEAGIGIIGENYVQEAADARDALCVGVTWHCIGHLQGNKVKRAVALFDLVQTVDCLETAMELDRHCAQAGRIMPVLLEVNSGREASKSGIWPENVESLVREIAPLPNIRVMGLMTMGPLRGEAREMAPYFDATRCTYERLRTLGMPNTDIKYLSMGMSASYRTAIELGANMVRLGRAIFEPPV